MTTAVFRPAPIPLHRSWWLRLLDDWRARRDRRRELELERDLWRSLSGLSESTLRDIGAPEWLHAAERKYESR